MELDYSNIDAELLAGLQHMPPGLDNLTRDTVVAVRAMRAAMPTAALARDVTIEAHAIDTTAGELPLLLYRPSIPRSSAAVLWLHGGGYILGTAADHRACSIAEALQCLVVSVDYRLAPEHPFPAGVEDCHASLLWLAEHAKQLNVSPERIAIAGPSGGGGMAAGLALLNRDSKGPPLALQLLLYPMIDNLHDTPSGQYVNHPVWNRQTSLNAWNMYLNGAPGLQASPYAAAARATDLAGLPATYLCVGSEDLFRDETIDYARRLLDAGVPTELSVFPGLYHGGDLFLPNAKVSQRLERSYLQALRDALEPAGVANG